MADDLDPKESELKKVEQPPVAPVTDAPGAPAEPPVAANIFENKEPEVKPAGPVDFSEAGSLDPSLMKTEVAATADIQSDLSADAANISNEAMGTKPQEKPAEPEPEKFPEAPTAPPVQSQVAADFGVGPAPAVPVQPVANPLSVPTQPATAPALPNGPMPEELKRWNWGAFFWSWIWGIANNTWIALLALLGPLSLVMMIILGLKGNEYAWKNRKFTDLQSFKKIQSAWAKWGVIVFILYIVMMIGGTILIINSLKSSSTSGNSSSATLDDENSIIESNTGY
jgi:hypothetical protein